MSTIDGWLLEVPRSVADNIAIGLSLFAILFIGLLVARIALAIGRGARPVKPGTDAGQSDEPSQPGEA